MKHKTSNRMSYLYEIKYWVVIVILPEAEKFSKVMEDTVYNVIRKERLLDPDWAFGKVAEVISNKQLGVYVNGGDVPISITCNPDVTFAVGDHVFILYVNGRKRDAYVPFKTGV